MKDSAAAQQFNPAPSEGWVPSSPVILSTPWNGGNSDDNSGATSSPIKPQVCTKATNSVSNISHVFSLDFVTIVLHRTVLQGSAILIVSYNKLKDDLAAKILLPRVIIIVPVVLVVPEIFLIIIVILVTGSLDPENNMWNRT